MNILSHRANLRGPDRFAENSIEAIRRALMLGFGIETDLRRTCDNRFYISHDAQSRNTENAFELFAKLFQQFPKNVIAMNVKELGYEIELVALVQAGHLGANAFYFDFELLEPLQPGRSQKIIRNLPGGNEIRLAARLSDRGEPLEQCLHIPADVVWADEFDSLWLKQEDVERVHQAGRLFYAISPELHGFDDAERMRRWANFKNWGIDGLCTDYPLSARDFFINSTDAT